MIATPAVLDAGGLTNHVEEEGEGLCTEQCWELASEMSCVSKYTMGTLRTNYALSQLYVWNNGNDDEMWSARRPGVSGK